MKKIALAMLLISPCLAISQPATDSLKTLLILRTSLQESERIDILNELAFEIRGFDPAQSLQYAREAYESASRVGYSRGKGRALLTIMDYHWMGASYANSLESGLEAVKTFESIDDKHGIMRTCFMLGLTYGELKDTVKRNNYYKRSLELALHFNDGEMLAKLYNAKGLIAANSNGRRDPKKGLPLYLKALKYVQSDDKAHVKVLILGNVGAAFDDDAPGNRAKALQYLNEALQLAKLQYNRRGEANVHLHLGCVYTSQADYSRADEHFRLAEKLSKQTNARRVLLSTYIGFIDSKLRGGNNIEAHEFQKQYAWARDSMFNADRAQQIADLETRFETQEKEKAIRALKSESQIRLLLVIVLVFGVLFIGGVSLYIVRLHRLRARNAKELLEVQQLLNEKLQDVDRLKTKFFTAISHEFRTPVTLILAPIENELKKKSSSEARESLLLIRRNANRLLELINQLLDLSKLGAGKMELHIQQGDLQQFLSVMSASFESLAEHKQIEFTKNIDISDGEYWFDRDKLEKIISNLLANAFKNTPAGGVVKLTAKSNDADSIEIVIADTGPGIPKEEQENVFSPFYQTRQTAALNEPGTGLGLSLVKELVKLYQGQIRLESSPDSGTCFTIVIAVSKRSFAREQVFEEGHEHFSSAKFPTVESLKTGMEKIHISNDGPPNDTNDTILIVEDNTDMREYMSAILQRSKYTVLTAPHGEEALELAVKFIPSLILSDLMMPKIDGMELTKKIKIDERTSHIPIILLTAKNEPESKLEGLKTGADDYLTKPFSPEELQIRIKNLIEQRKKLQEKFRQRILISATPITEVSLDEKFLSKARSIVESNISDYTFTVDKMADEMSLSRTQLLRKLKALTGLSSNDFIKDIRLTRAADMIRQKTDTITQIGYAVGFSDQSYFTKCFKKQFGVTPSECWGQEAARPANISP